MSAGGVVEEPESLWSKIQFSTTERKLNFISSYKIKYVFKIVLHTKF